MLGAVCDCKPCVQCGMERCVAGTPAECASFESCEASCMNPICTTTCSVSHLGGVEYKKCLEAQCSDVCSACPGSAPPQGD
jgi:hypothetical protein